MNYTRNQLVINIVGDFRALFSVHFKFLLLAD